MIVIVAVANRTVFVAAGVALTAPPAARTTGVDVAAASVGETMAGAAMVGGDVERKTRRGGCYYHDMCMVVLIATGTIRVYVTL